MASEEKKNLRNRIEAGEKMLEDHRTAYKAASERVERAVIFTGSEDDARSLAPDAFERVKIEEAKIAEIEKLLDERRTEFRNLGSS